MSLSTTRIPLGLGLSKGRAEPVEAGAFSRALWIELVDGLALQPVRTELVEAPAPLPEPEEVCP